MFKKNKQKTKQTNKQKRTHVYGILEMHATH